MLATVSAAAAPVRLAVFHTDLSRNGPGLLLRDIRRNTPDILAARDTIVAARPDILLLLRFDYDLDAVALNAFSALLAQAGHPMPHSFALRPNTGMATGMDMDGDGRTGTPDDAQGYGRFAGAGGMAIVSRYPLDAAHARDFSAFLWRDLPDALLPRDNGEPFPSAAVFERQRLSSTGHWQVPVLLPDGQRLTLLAWHAGPPVFGGPMERNLRRNHDETAFWYHFLNGALPFEPPRRPFALLGNSNLDVQGGDGLAAAMQRILTHPSLQDPQPSGIRPGAARQSMATAYWPRGPGAMRTTYLLPDSSVDVAGAGLLWPPAPARHALVWADITLPHP